MTFGSLFSGIGGIDLGLERAGMECKWQVEIDPYCQKVLAKHWPHVRRYDDVKAVGGRNLAPVDLIAGGFPCQDVSVAGKRAGLKEGNRSGLWFEYHRIICELRPRYVFVENVPGLLVDGMGIVLGDLAQSGYDAEWEVLSACSLGAPHTRERVWIVAYPKREGLQGFWGLEKGGSKALRSNGEPGVFTEGGCLSKWWDHEPRVGRVADGVPKWAHRVKSLGNAVVPQCAEYIGRRIMSHDQG
jgi:DNA (cytosine-5)-methyltransferase 1